MGFWAGMGLEVRAITRGLRASPSFTITVIAVIATTVAVNASLFSYIRGTLLDPPPYQNPEDIVIAWGSNPTSAPNTPKTRKPGVLFTRAGPSSSPPLLL